MENTLTGEKKWSITQYKIEQFEKILDPYFKSKIGLMNL